MSDEWSLTFALISETFFNSRDRGDIRGILESNELLEVIWASAEKVKRPRAAHQPSLNYEKIAYSQPYSQYYRLLLIKVRKSIGY